MEVSFPEILEQIGARTYPGIIRISLNYKSDTEVLHQNKI